MTSFKSQHYPASGNFMRVLQDYAMRYYAVLNGVVMIAVLLKVYVGQPILAFGVLGIAFSVFLGNVIAAVAMQNKIAEIFFVSDSFSVISVYDMLRKEPARSFPLLYANPTREQNKIQLHFRDKVIVLKREEWEEFDLIWNWLSQG